MKKNNLILVVSLLILLASASFVFSAETAKPLPPAKVGPQVKPAHVPSPIPPPVKPVKPGEAQPQAQTPLTLPVVQTPENVYNYNPLGKPDPFRPFVDIEVAAVKKEKEAKKESIFPLQRAEVESFKLVGIVGDQARRVAVVEDSTKKYYPIFVGTKIGLHDGKVTEILMDRVTVDEWDGKKMKRIVLKLRKNI
jgi:type IV pilus assembly protein PilP